ncbi:MAG: phosphoenolpyruvate synthase [Dehalococcoidia bacterium]
MTATTETFVRWFSDVGMGDVATVGGKNASLGEMIQHLGSSGVRVPDGFAVTADAFRLAMRESGLDARVHELLDTLDPRDVAALRTRGEQLRLAIGAARLPEVLERAIIEAYRGLGDDVSVAVRSSATAEDLPEASFAGQQETFLNVRGEAALLEACRRSYASLFTDRAISYRALHGFDHSAVALSVGVQRMVRSDLGASGVMFTLDTETGFRAVVLINAAYGLGENIVQGTVTPDEFYVFKPTLETGHKPIIRRQLGTKELRMVYGSGGKQTRNVRVDEAERRRFSVTNEDVLQLARWGIAIEQHYTAERGLDTPMDIEWAKDGETGKLFIVQARPETVQARRTRGVLETYHLRERGPVLVRGQSVGTKIASGTVRVMRRLEDLTSFKPGEVLVAERTDPDWEPVMKQAAAVVTDQGGRTCHAAIVSRELGVPAIVGTEDGTSTLHDGQQVTISCAAGDVGLVYEGLLPFDVESVDVGDIPRPRTQVMMNVADPSEAFSLAALPNDGVGLVREEFIINHAIGVHPLALVRFDELEDEEARARIEARTSGWPDKAEYFVDRLAEGVGMIAAAFYPKDVIVRLSDFKTNEYANLLGGRMFEPHEENPMLGFRGASRYYDERFRDGFALECRALTRVRDEFGLTNVKVMVPFCRTPEEGRLVRDELARYGLQQGENGLELYVMCEIPSNVVQASAFAEVFDGFSIGSNDLTQLVLGVDRDSEVVAHLFDERDPAVKAMVSEAIRAAHEAHRKIGICGQAPSDYPEFARFLVEQGIDSVSLNPDSVLRTTQIILEAERDLSGGA